MFVTTQQSYFIPTGKTELPEQLFWNINPIADKRDAYQMILKSLPIANQMTGDYDTDGCNWIEYEHGGRYYTLKVYELTFHGERQVP